MDIRRCGDRALLVEVADTDAVVALHWALRADPPEGTLELVPAARTVLVVFDPAVTDARRLAADLRGRRPVAGRTRAGRLVELPTTYDGLDLAKVADRTALSPAEVVARHQAVTYTVAFCGFAPGFGYLTGTDPRLHLPRRSSPRTRVPAGSVAIAGEFSGVYPRVAPGGWHLLGHTDAQLWAIDRERPALLTPGDRVRFVPS
jgi:KipI family sensor histidine kinase inhibitor